MQMPMGQYRPGNTFFHRADAKGKLLGLCLVIAAVIVSKGLIGCIAAAAAALTVSYLAGISLREQIKQQKGMCRFLAVIFLMNAFLQRGALHLELVDFPAEPGGNPAGGDGGRSPGIDFSFLYGADDHDRADGNHAWAGGAAFTAFEGRCSDGRNCDDSGGCNAVYSGAGRGSGDNPDGADCTRGSV